MMNRERIYVRSFLLASFLLLLPLGCGDNSNENASTTAAVSATWGDSTGTGGSGESGTASMTGDPASGTDDPTSDLTTDPTDVTDPTDMEEEEEEEEGPEDCLEGEQFCDDECVDVRTDDEHCGSCDFECDEELEICSEGSCTCKVPLTECNGLCVDTHSDPLNCGECGLDCGGQFCQQGMCADSCAEPTPTSCGGACVDLLSDGLHCGMCGEPCENDEVCAGGECYEGFVAGGCDACPCDECVGETSECCDVLGLIVCAEECE